MLKGLYLRFLAKRNPVKYARKMGVKIGNNNRIVSCRHGMFGSEPYLVTIGSDCLFSGDIQFLTHDGSLDIFRKEIPNAFIYKPVKVGNNVFLGFRVTIMPGVTIGDNVAIGAGSVVTKDIPSNTIAAGVPAKVLRTYDEYKEKMIPQLDKINGLNKIEKKEYLIKKYNLKSS
jgi:Acetyltransferase (isoleucine patch superfamily)